MKKLILTIALCFICSTALASSRLNDPQYLTGYWRLNSNANDYSGHGNNGTWTGDETYVTAPWGGTIGDFDEVDDGVDVGANTVLGSMSVCAWINKVADSSVAIVVDKGDGSNIQYRILFEQNTGYRFYTGSTGSSNYARTGESVEEFSNSYHFICGIYDGTDTKVYFDGGIRTNASAPLAPVQSTENMWIGLNGADTSADWKGQIGEVRLYNIALTADEVFTLYNMALPQYTTQQQPYDILPDVSDSTLVGAWLNKAVILGNDLSSNNLDMTVITGSPDFFEGGMDFDGSADAISDADNSVYDLSSQITMSAWVKTDTVSDRDSILYREGAYKLRLFGDTDSVESQINSTTCTSDSTEILVNQWYYLVATYDQVSQLIYKDGVLIKTCAFTDAISNTSRITIIGAGAGGDDVIDKDFFDGTIKDARLYSEAKTAAWIKNEYQKSVPDDSLVIHVVDGDKDLSRYAHTLTNSGAVLGNGMEFDGVDDTIVVSAGSGVLGNFGSPKWSITAIINPKSMGENNHGRIWCGSGESTDSRFRLFAGGGGTAESVELMIGFSTTNAEARTDDVLLFGAKQHLVGVFNEDDDNKIKIYFNGNLSSLTTDIAGVGSILDDSLHNKEIGNIFGSQSFDGHIYDLRIYRNEAKSADWIKTDYERTKAFY